MARRGAVALKTSGAKYPKTGPARASRRGFLAGSLALPAAAASAGPDPLITELQPWSRGLGEGVDATPYGMPIRFEGDVVRRTVDWLTNDPYSGVNFTPIHALDGTITPQGCAFERHHSGAIELAKSEYRLMVHGAVGTPLVFTYADLERFPRVTRTAFCECAANGGMEWGGAQLNGAQFTHGMIHNMEYVGVPLRALLEEAGADLSMPWIYVEGHDAAGNGRSIPMDKALDDCIVAFKANGEALRMEHGYPARLVVPGWEGNVWIKWLRRIEVMAAPVEAREETSKYTDLLPNGRARKWTWVMDAKSIITSPSPQMPIAHGTGPLVVSGLAWSGHGRITGVDVSTDGGANWAPARLAGAPGDKTVVRFYFDMDWDGSEMLLQSRARDESGYVQPTKAALVSKRGRASVYHNNAIQTWLIRSDGSAENVELS